MKKRFITHKGHQILAKYIGKRRTQAKPASIRYNDSDYHLSTSDRSHPHIIGAACELAYAEITNQEPDLNFHPKGDIIDFNGIEIKSSTYNGKDIELKVKVSEFQRKKDLTKAYILCRTDEKISFVEFIGCISKERFDKIKREKTYKFKRVTKGSDVPFDSFDSNKSKDSKVVAKKNPPKNWVVQAKDLKQAIVYIKNGQFKFIELDN
jgi:hypothetical protein